MLKNKPTLLLATALVSMGIFCLLPLWDNVSPHEAHHYTLYPWKLQERHDAINLLYIWKEPYKYIGWLAILIMFITYRTLTRTNNRKLQVRLGIFNIVLISILMIVIAGCIYLTYEESMTVVKGRMQLGIFMPIIAMIVTILANREINRERKLIESSLGIRR